MTITLGDIRKTEKDALTRGFLDVFLMRNKLAQYLPVQKTTALRQRILRYSALPTPTWRQLNAYYGASQGSTDWMEETVYDVGQYFDVDVLLSKDTSTLQDPRVIQAKLASEALAFELNNVLVNGSSASDQPDGLSARVALLGTTQDIDTSSVDISAATGTTTTMNTFLDFLDQVLYAIDNGDDFNEVVLLGNDNLMLRLWSVLRRLGLLDTTKDQFGREIRTYKGAKLLDAGVKADQTTRIIPTASNLTSLYAFKMGDDFLSMLQFQALDVKDLGQIPGTRTLRTEVSWVWGLTQPHPRGLARLKNIKVS